GTRARPGSTNGTSPVVSASARLRSRTGPGVASWSPPERHDALRVVSRARERDRRVRAADDRRRPRSDALRTREAALLAALRDRGRPSLRRPAHRNVRVDPRADAVRGLVPAVLADPVGCPGRLELPAARDRARGRRRGAPARARDHQPVSGKALIPLLAP